MSILFINSFSKAAYKYFNYFGPWTADVHRPLLKLRVMNMDLSIEQFVVMKTMLAAMLTDMAAEMAAWRRTAGGSITEVAVTLAGKADSVAVNVWCADVRPASDQVRPKNMNRTRNGKIARLPQTIREELNQGLEQGANGVIYLDSPHVVSYAIRVDGWGWIRTVGVVGHVKPATSRRSGVGGNPTCGGGLQQISRHVWLATCPAGSYSVGR